MAKIFKTDPDACHDPVHPASMQGQWADYGVAPSANDSAVAGASFDDITALLDDAADMQAQGEASGNSRLIGSANEQVTYLELRLKYPAAARANVTQPCKVKVMGFDKNGAFSKLRDDDANTVVELTCAATDEIKGSYAYSASKRWDLRGHKYALPVITQALAASAGLDGSERIEFIGY